MADGPKALSFIAARGIPGEGTNNLFAPGKNITRADFLVMVMKAYGIEADAVVSDNFIDAGDTYYTKYLGTAKRLGLVSGGGGNRYSPESNLSRQDMMVIMYNVLNKLGELPKDTVGRSLEAYSDAGSIAPYAKKAVKLFTETGIIMGNGKELVPNGTSTRAQIAQVLYNLLTK